MEKPYRLTAARAVELMRSGALSVEHYTASLLERIRAVEPKVGAWVHLDEESALSQARALDRRRAAGAKLGSLFGISVGVKDIFNTRDMPTCMGSPIWEGFTPGNDARVVYELRRHDAVIPGKTVTAEFAVHYPGKTMNPHNPAHSPGTSSSGSAAAVATGMVPLSIGTQTAGSTIRPASFCGVYGFKPSFGLIPRTGILKTLDTLDHVAFFARCVEDLELMFDAIRVHGPDYPYVHSALEGTKEQWASKRWRVGFVRTRVWDQAEDYVKRALEGLAKELACLDEVDLVESELTSALSGAHDVHTVVYEGSLAYYFRDEYEHDRARLSPIFREMVERGRAISTPRLKEGIARQNELAREMDLFLRDFDVIFTNSTAHVAPNGLHTIEKRDPCLIWTLCRVPSLNLPLFTGPGGLPFGAQVVARRYSDYKLLGFISYLEKMGLAPEAPNPHRVIE